MTTTPSAPSEIEERLRAALAARADLVRPEDLAPVAPVVEPRPRWQSPWVLLATAAVVLLVLGVVLQGVGGRERTDRIAPKPDEPEIQLELPADIGRDWTSDEFTTPARLDLDGDGIKEKVDFLGEKTKEFDGRTRLQTTLSSTGEEAYGIAELGTTIGTTALDPIDADGDGDQELVLWRDETYSGPYLGSFPLVFDLRDGLLVQAVPDEPELLVRGSVPVPGTKTEHYEMVHEQDYWVEDGALWSSRSVNAYASGNMTIVKPMVTVRDAWTWRLADDGLLEHVDAGCLRHDSMVESPEPCEEGAVDDLPPVGEVASGTFGPGEGATFDTAYPFTARIESGADLSLVVEGIGDGPQSFGLEVADPRVSTTQPVSIFADGVSLIVTSAADPRFVMVLIHDGERFRVLEPIGEVVPTNDDSTRTWQSRGGGLVTAVAGDDDTWRLWFWQMTSRTEMTALPGAVVCFDDPTDPSTMRRC